MPKIREVTVYQFDELGDEAKARAREWYREASADDSYWSEYVIEDAATALAHCGFDVRQRPVKLMGGGMRQEPAIYWSGFWSQGDGACFEGAWSPASIMSAEQFASEYPGDSPSNVELRRIHAGSVQLAALDPTNAISWRCSHTGRYCHEQSVTFSYEDEREPECSCLSSECEGVQPDDIQDEHEENARDAMRWIYSQLEAEYEYRNADEQIDEDIRANEYTFTEDGRRF